MDTNVVGRSPRRTPIRTTTDGADDTDETWSALRESVLSVSGAAGSSDTEGKAAKGSGERGGSRASFKSVVLPIAFMIRVYSPAAP
jgi:hypothetical protein